MMDSKAIYGGEGANITLRSFTFGAKHMRAVYYHLCAPEVHKTLYWFYYSLIYVSKKHLWFGHSYVQNALTQP